MSVSIVNWITAVYTTATSQSAVIPANCLVGDFLIAAVMHRDTLTPPSGWSLVASRSCGGGGFTQYLSVYSRTVQSGDPGSSTMWTQATSQRMSVGIVALAAHGSASVVDYDTAHQDNISTSSNVGNMAVSTATSDGQIGLSFATCPIANSLPTVTTMTASDGRLISNPSVADNRFAAAWRVLNAGETTTGTFTTNVSPTDANGWAAVSVVVGDSDVSAAGLPASRLQLGM